MSESSNPLKSYSDLRGDVPKETWNDLITVLTNMAFYDESLVSYDSDFAWYF